MEAMSAHQQDFRRRQDFWRRQRPTLFLAEVIFEYCEGAQVKSLVLKLRDRFPGAELVFDAASPLHVWVSNLQVSRSRFGARLDWGIWHGQEIEKWAEGIRLLDEWGFFDQPEPRLAFIRWMRPIEELVRTFRIYHFRLGEKDIVTEQHRDEVSSEQ